MNAQNGNSLGDYVAALKRRRSLLFTVWIAIFGLGVAIALVLPAVYRSEAVILIEQQAIPSELVRSTVTSFADQRLQEISQRVMTSSNLLEIIDKYSLYEEESKTEVREVIIQGMRDDIELAPVSAEVVDPQSRRPMEATIAFRIGYENESPQLAQKVANELASLYLNENIRSRTESASETASFLTEEASRLGEQVSELEARLATFKEENADSAPGMEELTRTMINRMDLEIAEVERRLGTARQQRIFLQAELEQIEPYGGNRGPVPSTMDRLEVAEAELTAAEAAYASSHPDVVRLRKQVEGLRKEVDPDQLRNMLVEQLETASAELAELRERYNEGHPDLDEQEDIVNGLRRKLDELPADSEKKPTNPAYITIAARLDAARSEIGSLESKKAELNVKYEQALTNLARIPESEARYRAISREYENTVQKYREVTAKQMEARLSQNLEAEQKGERFTLIEPPLLPEAPAWPNRFAFAVISFVLAVAGALIVIGLAESLDTRIRGRNGVQRLLSAPPLAVVPPVYLEGEVRSMRRRTTRAIAVAFVLIVMGLIAFHLFVKPLDVTWFVLMRRLGL